MAAKLTKMKMPGETYKKIYLWSTILIGLALTAFLVQSLLFSKNKGDGIVDFSFIKESNPVSPNVNLKLLLNPGRYKISFVQVKLYFDPEILELVSEVSPEKSPLIRVVSVTAKDEANKTGIIELVLAQEPGTLAVTKVFELAQLTLSPKQTETPETEVTIVDEDTQVVDINSNILPFTAAYVKVK